MKHFVGALALLCGVGAAAAPSALSWGQFAHDAGHTGRSSVVAAQSGKLKFQTALYLDIYVNSVAIDANNMVYAATQGNSAIESLVFAINGSNGAMLWNTQLDNPSKSSPALSADGKTLYVANFGGVVSAMNLATRKMTWNSPTFGPIFSSPCVSPDFSSLYIGSADGNLYSLSMATGSVQWTAGLEGIVEASSPAIDGEGNVIMSVYSSGMLISVNGSTGGYCSIDDARGMAGVRILSWQRCTVDSSRNGSLALLATILHSLRSRRHVASPLGDVFLMLLTNCAAQHCLLFLRGPDPRLAM